MGQRGEDGVFTKADLIKMQAYPFNVKIGRTQTRIIEWFSRWNQCVYISFSGGKDSTVLADLAARICKGNNYTLYLIYVDTGLEYPEIKDFVEYFAQWLREQYEITVVLDIEHPDETFDRVVQRKGYPLVSKEISHVVYGGRRGQPSCLRKLRGEKLDHDGGRSKYNCPQWAWLLDVPYESNDECCTVMKKRPAKRYEKRTGRKMITAEMAEESQLRQTEWLQNGCNAFDLKRPKSTPMAFWTNQDVLRYLLDFKIPYCSVYGQIIPADDQMTLDYPKLKTTGCDRTGCMFCGFGLKQEKGKNRFQLMKETHPQRYSYCMAEPRIIDKIAGREIFHGMQFKMAWAQSKRREIGDKAFDKQYHVTGGLGLDLVLENMNFEH